jgi:hypothetical protein
VRGETLSDATTIIESAKLQVAGETRDEPSDDVAANRVIRTDPPAGQAVDRNTEVTLIVSSGPVPDTPTPTPTPTPSSMTLPYRTNESGWVTQSGGVGTGSTRPPQAGDFNNNAIVRGFLSFDLTGLPSDANVQSASLTIPGINQLGAPFPSFGTLTFEALWYGTSLAPAAYGRSAYTVLHQTNQEPSYPIEVTAGVEEAVSQGYSRFQIRFRFDQGTDNDGSADEYIVRPDRGEPVLEVVYTRP